MRSTCPAKFTLFPNRSDYWFAGWVVIVTLGLSIGLLTLPQDTARPLLWPRWGMLMGLAWWLPGVLLVAHWRLQDQDRPTAVVLALGLGWCWLIVGLLLIHWWPGPISLAWLVGVYGVGNLGLVCTLPKRQAPPRPTLPPSIGPWLIGLLALTMLLRLPGLGYHEFHYDEVLVLTRAREAIRGEEDALARHTKGPGEIAVATVIYRALGTGNEATTRLPFALASVASVIALACLGARLFSWPVGLIGGGLLAVNGFALGLSRLVQYQPAMLLLSILAVMAAWEFAQRGEQRWLTLVAIFSAFGLIMHYEFGLLAPLLILLAALGWRRSGFSATITTTLLGATVLAGALVAATYLPLLRNAFFASTQNYLSTRLGDAQAWNFAFFLEMGTFYNSIYFFGGLIALALAGLLGGWRRASWPTRLLLLWFLPYLVLYLLIIQFPGTHFYLLMPAWSLLAALPLAGLIKQRGWPVALRGALAGLVILWLGVTIYYLYLLFFRQAPEYLVNYQAERVPFYWAPYGQNIPEKPRFGFPIQEGWKTLGVLAEWNYLGQTYASNERSRHLRWYLGGFERVDRADAPDYILVAQHLQERDPAFNEEWLQGYQQVGDVRVRGEPRIALWARQPLPVAYVSFAAEQFAPIFDTLVPVLQDWSVPSPQVQDHRLDERITLVAARVDHTRLSPGANLHLRLDWQMQQPVTQDLKLFVHVAAADGQPVAQWDGLPGLNTVRTSLWPVGKLLRDHVLLPIPAAVAPGEYTLLVGLYDPTTGVRVGGQAIAVTRITLTYDPF